MPTRILSSVSWLHQTFATERADRDLLASFTAGDEAAFAELVRRHGPMVLGVCERVLGNRDDAEDAYQSTFLALAEQASRADWRESLSGWLHDVAWRTANAMRKRAARRRALERDRPPRPPESESTEALDEELRRLPTAMREAVLCCYLQGLTRQQAAAKLGWSLRTLDRRLDEGRRRLRQRLEARGEPVPALLAGPAFSLTSVLGRWWLVAGLLLACGGGLAALPRSSEPTPVAAVNAEEPAALVEPLPPLAIARLGETRFRHGTGVHDLTLSADGNVLATSGYSRRVCLWDAATGKLLRDLTGEKQSYCRNVAFSPDGRQFVPSLAPLRIFDVSTGKVVRDLAGGGTHAWNAGVAWSDDGKWIASAGSEDNSIQIWDAASGEQRRVIPKRWFRTHAAFAPGSKEMLTFFSREEGYLLDLASGKERPVPAGRGAGVLAVAFSRDGKHLALLCGEQRNVKQRTPGEPPGELRVWDTDGKSEPRLLSKDIRDGRCVAFAPDGEILAVGCGDGSIRLVGVETGKELRRWTAHGDAVTALAFSPDGKVLFASANGGSVVRRWDPHAGKEVAGEGGHVAPVTRLRFRPDGKALVSLDEYHALVHWNRTTRAPTPRRRLPGRGDSVSAMSADASLVATESNVIPGKPKGIGVYDARTGERRLTLEGPVHKGFGFAFDPQAKRLARAGHEGEIKLWDLADGKCLWQFEKQAPGAVERGSPLRFSRDGRLLVVGGYETAVDLLDAATGKPLHRFEVPGNERVPAFAADFSPDGELVAFPTLFWNTPVVLLETRTGKVRRTWRTGQAGGFLAVEFSPDGRLLATAHYDHPVKLWDVATGQEVAAFPGQGRDTYSVAFSPDGRMLASGGGDSTILLWDATGRGEKAGKPLAPNRLRELWDDLTDDDAKKVYTAGWELALSPDGAVPFLRERVTPVKSAVAGVVDGLVKRLGGDEFAERQSATRELERLGAAAIPRLKQVLEGKPDVEVRRRIEAVVAAYHRSDEWQRHRQALAVLERGGSAAARKLIAELAGGAEGAPLTEEARAAAARAKRAPK